MSQIEDSTSTTATKPRSGCFLGCSRFSRQKVADKSPHGDATDVNTISRKKARRFSWSLFCIKSSDAKTVPVDPSTVSEKVNRNEHNSQTSPKHPVVPVIRDIPVPDHQTLVHDNSGQKFDDECDRLTHEEGENIILQAGETLDIEESSKSKSKSESKSKSKDRHSISLSRKSSSNQKGEKASNGEAMRKQLLQSASFQMLNLEGRNRAPQADRDGVDYSKQRRNKNAGSSSRAKLEPVVGLSILMVTLIIMLVWGRLCAILCTSAWFYFIPLLGNLNNKAASQGTEKGSVLSTDIVEMEKEQGLDSEYNKTKKRVVLEGFLNRDRRISLGN